ncbi:hypothetical protein KKI24_12930 [bacterium]|nr:hypothetical protein [bacterium]
MFIGFNLGGWSTTRTTRDVAQNAVMESYAAICVAQFMQEPTADEKLKAFSALSASQRYGYMEKGGWDKMPGQETADAGVSRACISGIAMLVKN